MRHNPILRLTFQVLAAVFASISAPASVAAISLHDLDGLQIDLNITFDRQIQVNGRTSSDRVGNNLQIRIDGVSLHTDFFSVVTGPRGTYTNPHRTGSATIGKPHPVQFLGSGHVVWLFEGGKLVSLRVYRQGAFKTVISFNRTTQGLACTALGAFARETGVGTIEFQTEETGRDIKVLSAKLVSSSCRVTAN